MLFLKTMMLSTGIFSSILFPRPNPSPQYNDDFILLADSVLAPSPLPLTKQGALDCERLYSAMSKSVSEYYTSCSPSECAANKYLAGLSRTYDAISRVCKEMSTEQNRQP